MTDEDLLKDYRAAFLRFLARQDEETLTQAYDLGRRGLVAGVSLLEVVRVHHVVLAEVVASGRPGEGDGAALAASRFLLEVLASYEMDRR